MNNKARTIISVFTLLSALFTLPAFAEVYKVRMHVNQPASAKSYQYEYASQFADRVNKYTQGAFKVTIFPGAQLGGDPAVFQQMQMGAIQAGIFAFPNLVEFYKPFNIFSLPLLFEDFDSAVTAFKGPTARKLYGDFEDHTDVKVLGVFNEGFRGITNSVKPIEKVEDFSGLKIRVPGSPILISTLESLGMSPISISGGEIFSALQQGTVDGQESTVAWGYSQGYAEAQKYLTETRHAVSGAGLYINAKFFNSLPEGIQAAVIRAAEETADHINGITKKYDHEVIDLYRAAGLKATVLDISAIRPRIEHIWEEYASIVGGMDLIKNLIEDGKSPNVPSKL